ncbi:chromate transporter [Paenibacillus sp. 481]|uniref:chromate transporter n=1 Tax=Paenibacillus sp. 481 TaxID=2835869 RepID=UPI001E405520|nr:chromate transporter [Paenibacillus sp. 481]UHA74889.1 chromate transporter [Paenibacillus sp. 481]
MLWDLFWTFLKLGFVSFGGGYAMLPVIEHEAIGQGWMNAEQYADAIALAGMAPGSIAMNSAIYVGYATAGVWGSVVSTIGIVIPSVFTMFMVATLFYRMYHNDWVQSALDGMKPAVIALIAYAAVSMVTHSGLIQGWSIGTLFAAGVFICALLALLRFRLHPIAVILLSGIAGIIIYG